MERGIAAGLVALAGLGCQPDMVAVETDTDTTSSGTEATGPTTVGVDETTGTTTGGSTAGMTGSTTDDPTTGTTGTTTGEPPNEDATLVIYLVEPVPGEGSLHVVDVSGDEPSPPAPWSPDAAAGGGDASPSVRFLGSGGFASFSVRRPDDTRVRYVGPLGSFPPEPPVPIEGPGLPLWVDHPAVSGDDQFIVFNGGDESSAAQTEYVGQLAADGSVLDVVVVGSGSSATTTGDARFTDALDRVFFVSDEAQVDVEQLHMQMLPPDEPAFTLSDNPGHPLGWFTTQDGQIAVYGLLDGNFELYAVDLTGAMPGAPVRVDGDHIPAGARSFRIVPASHDLVYLAERLDPAGDVDLYLEDLDSPDPPVLASDLPVDYSPGNPFGEIDLSPAGDLVVYRAYETDPFYKSAYWVSPSLGPPSTMLHAPLAASETVSLVSFSDSGNLLMYTVLDRDTDERSAYLVDTSGDVPDVPMALGLTVDADEEPVLLYASPDDAWIVYTTRHPTMGATPSVWIRDIAAGEDTRLSQPDAGDVGARAYFTPDSLRVLFTQRTEDPDDPHLFMVKLDSGAPQPAQQVSTELLAFDDPFVAP